MKQFFGKQVIERPRQGSSNPSAKARWYGKMRLDEDNSHGNYPATTSKTIWV